jgi:transposase
MEAKKWIGVDIHKKQMTVCIILETGKKEIKRYERNSAGIADFLKEVDKGTVVGVESTTWTWDLARKAEPLAQDMLILNTVALKEKMSKIRKSDQQDSEQIATIIRRFDKEELSRAMIKTEKWSEVKGLLKIREKTVGQKVETKNLIIAMLDHWGIEGERKLFYNRKKDREWLERISLLETIKKEIISQYELVMQFEDKIKELDKIISGLCENDAGYKAITEHITGIGKTCGAYLVSKIENIERFDDPKKLTAYFGLVPKLNESDDKKKCMHITKNTDAPLLRVLVQAAWAAVRFDTNMRYFYEGLRVRKGKQKAIIAVARKLVVLVYYHMKRNEA